MSHPFPLAWLRWQADTARLCGDEVAFARFQDAIAAHEALADRFLVECTVHAALRARARHAGLFVRYRIRPDPPSSADAVLGEVEAPDVISALIEAQKLYGPAITVEPPPQRAA